MKFGSVCSGIEAASVAWHPLGWKAAWLSEIEPFPSAVLAHHYPDVPNLGDMTTLPERILSGEVEAPDVFCGGTPCQAFSVAGLRNSLDDARGNLSLTFCEIANAIDIQRITTGMAPSIVFWENVPGVLSTKDNAFGCFLGALAGEVEALEPPGGKWTNAGCVSGPQRTVAWRVLDAQYFGVAQRRRRVFVVASARADFDPTAVLFEFDGLRRDTAPSREARKEVTECAGTLTANGGGLNRPAGNANELDFCVTVAQCLTAGSGQRYDPETETISPIALQDITPREKAQNGKGWNDDGTAYTVDTHATQGVAQPISIHPHCIGRAPNAGPQGKEYLTDGSAYCMDSRGQPQAVAQPVNIYGGNKRPDRPEGGFYVRTDEDTSKTLDAATGLNPTCSQGGTAVMQPMVLMDQGGSVMNVEHDMVGTLRRETHGHEPAVIQPPAMQVRRLTPVECERLQGFPDNYTAIPWRKKPVSDCPDGPRYKALGNSWAVPVVAWIGRRIAKEIKNADT